MKMKRFVFFVLSILGTAGVWAQIPAEVTEVMDRCRAAMTNASGLEYEMDIKAGRGPLSMKMHMVVANKGDLSRTTVSTKVLGMEVVVESGFDGTDTWEIDHSPKGDTITFTQGNHAKKNKKSNEDLVLDQDKQFNKAKMKLKDGYYVIAFSDPKDKSSKVKSVTVSISAKSYTMREVRSGAGGAKVTMTVTKIRVGLNDSYFKLDLSKYPNAVIIRQ